ncbi:MAG: hypothetical protein HN855_01155 [Anaerolineae bacterium]|jgi:hypothetical protein|nr:hypothetical protein [Anaerolineae bacterium]MBT7071043.1 hypothetical protein [Anaerolineae bacterium]MBT7323749.1 hypothetical protein [Anaerolineae bacterium]
MTKTKYLLFTLLLFIFFAGCSPTITEQETPVQEPIEEATLVPTLPPPPTPTSEPEIVSYCLDCHTDKERLISTAKPEEEIISENKGEG